MKKGISYVYNIVLVVCTIIFVSTLVNGSNSVVSKSGLSGVDLVSNYKTEVRNGTSVYSFFLPKGDLSGKVLKFDTSHMAVNVKIADYWVYGMKSKSNSIAKTTGSQWNTIYLEKDNSQAKVEVYITPYYHGLKPSFRCFYGDQGKIDRQIIGKNAVRMILSVFTLILGLFLLLYSLLVLKEHKKELGIVYLAEFSILLGIWSMLETPVIMLYVENGVALTYLTHLSLMVMPVAFVFFLQRQYQASSDSRLWGLFCWISVITVAIRLVLQVLQIKELRETLILTHINVILLIVLVLYMSIRQLILLHATKEVRKVAICMFLIMICTFADLFFFNNGNKTNSYGIDAFLIYIIVMSFDLLKRSRKMSERANESEIYRKLAYIDELTGTFNRNAYVRDYENFIQEKNVLPMAVYMFDLNELKLCNDTYGHDAGDQYIIMVADVIKQQFEVDGRCYRMGGDEFCVVMPYKSKDSVENNLAVFQHRIKMLNREAFYVKISVAVGYALYDPEKDNTLNDTKARADEQMYMNKTAMKKKLKAI